MTALVLWVGAILLLVAVACWLMAHQAPWVYYNLA